MNFKKIASRQVYLKKKKLKKIVSIRIWEFELPRHKIFLKEKKKKKKKKTNKSCEFLFKNRKEKSKRHYIY